MDSTFKREDTHPIIGRWFGPSKEDELANEKDSEDLELKGMPDEELEDVAESDFEDFTGVERKGQTSGSDHEDDDDDDHGGEWMPVIDF